MIRIITWNMGHAVRRDLGRRRRAWAHLAELRPDVALVQEAGLPVEGPSSEVWAAQPEPPDGQSWNTGVVGYAVDATPFTGPVLPFYYRRKTPVDVGTAARPGSQAARPRTLAIAEVRHSDAKPIIAISLYGALRYAEQSVARALADIMPIFDDTHMPKRIILGGDLNIHTHTEEPRSRARARAILELAESLGMWNLARVARERGILNQGRRASPQPCPCYEVGCDHVRTHRHPQHRPGAMANNDYLFATPALARELVALTVMNGDADPAWSISDHCPLVAEFEL